MKNQNKFNHTPLRIVLGITGGIAAYKCPELIRQLKALKINVQVVCTPSALQFVTPLTLQAVSGQRVFSKLWDYSALDGMRHIECAKNTDLILIAPASADFIAKLALGFADNLLLNLCLAATTPILVAPAMNEKMWMNPATQKNILRLKENGIHILPVGVGEQACGDVGPGRMLEPAELVQQVQSFLRDHFQTLVPSHLYLKGKKILITCGPTQEALDPVRYLTNKSSGKMGVALAQAALKSGAEVTLICGPISVQPPAQAQLIEVTTAQQMFDAVLYTIKEMDIFISVAAVSDYRFEKISEKKISKADLSENLQLNLIPNKDILSEVAHLPSKPFCVGFAAQSHDVLDHGKRKLTEKKADMMIVNDISEEGIGFHSDENACTVLWGDQKQIFPRTQKTILADQLLQLIAKVYGEQHEPTS